MKTVFVGAVEGSMRALEAICDAGRKPALVVTLPPHLCGRHSDYVDLAPMARAWGIPVHHTLKTDSPETCAAVAAVAPDLTMVIGWSQICGPKFRNIALIGTLGFHPSPLPRMRGRGVIPWTILRNEPESGATLFWLGEGVDTGPIAAQKVFPVDPRGETARSLYDKSTDALAKMLPPLLERLERGERPAEPQNEKHATLCARRRPTDGWIDWSAPAETVERLVRAVGPPYPGAFTTLPDGTRLTITEARVHPRRGYYIGLPGQVQAVGDNDFTVYCGDAGCVAVSRWHGSNSPPPLHSILGRGTP